jgi:hypothetical protein
MEQNNSQSIFENEFEIFQKLEEKIDGVLVRAGELKAERDVAINQKNELESLLRRREAQIVQLQDKLNEAERKALTPEKENLIKQKLQSLIERLDEY